MTAYTYLLRCADGTLYCGWTNDLAARLAAHNSGKGAKYTRARRPVRLVYSEPHPTRGEAMRREAAIKRLSRAEKEALLAAQEARCPVP
ncbi:MAG: GIY-YIG nuclease family protein [Agathobaculum sp.]|uniref:GIY-YIG nuclease family protein n=1 Tax=Agathobaculum sp. TaxID=2048138 RepID=UPI0025C3AE30|nr:GIY-YIG nuclease family protein [Agathobaculum sp.]MCI7125045.1 GIY-YIG nuclease family protein [Agathobaculum sp.]MDY3710839.1 GIY-YIG nuclease family protein [Agathobaculum sp.]